MHAVVTRRDGTTYTRPIDTIPDMHAAFFEALCHGQRGLDAVQDGNTTRCEVESLEDLLEILTLCYEDAPVVVGAARLEDLPTFGTLGAIKPKRVNINGESHVWLPKPDGLICVWSWDDTRMLIGGAVHDLRIVPRKAAAS